MTLWKVNEKHLNCVITQAEMKEMGFELSQLQESKEQMSLFLEMILENGKKLFNLDTREGIQRFQLRLMQNQSIFLSISCEDTDEEINHSLEEIDEDMNMVKELTSKENMDHLKSLEGEQKAQEFGAFVANLKNALERHNRPMQQAEVEVVEKKEVSFLYNVKFPSLERAIEFCHYYPADKQIKSSLFKHREEYYLTADFNQEFSEAELTNFILRAGEFEGKFDTNPFLRTVMEEHGSCVIRSDAINALRQV